MNPPPVYLVRPGSSLAESHQEAVTPLLWLLSGVGPTFSIVVTGSTWLGASSVRGSQLGALDTCSR